MTWAGARLCIRNCISFAPLGLNPPSQRLGRVHLGGFETGGGGVAERVVLSWQDKAEVWRLRAEGLPIYEIARRLCHTAPRVRAEIRVRGGCRPRAGRARSVLRLSVGEREGISRGVAAGRSVRQIARD